MNKQKMLLSGTWKLCWMENRLVQERGFSITDYAGLTAPENLCIDAAVPGNFELSLEHAGILPDARVGLHAAELKKWEHMHVWYGRRFEFDGETGAGKPYLHFEGLDTFTEIYLNGEKIGQTDNMLISHDIPADRLRRGSNDLVVHILPAVIVARGLPSAPGDFAQYYNYASLRVRKAAHSFGWDIMPRAVSAGIWRDVSLCVAMPDELEETYLYPVSLPDETGRGSAVLYYRARLSQDDVSRYQVRIEGQCGTHTFYAEDTLWFSSGRINVGIPDALVWNPAGRGTPHLYDVTVTLLLDGREADTRRFRFGLRTVELLRTSTADNEGNGEFLFKVNGEKLFIKGANWVPVDAFHSRDRERIPYILPLATELHCNMIRCWGGNVYEDHDFFDYCDTHGILVWQDFAMGCAVYPHDEELQRQIALETRAIVKKLRQHPSLALWAGDNECDVAAAYWTGIRRNPNRNILTRQVIPDVLETEDPARIYLPSSPYIDEAAFASGSATPEDHLWGPRNYYKSTYYRKYISHFASEMGYHGSVSPATMRDMLSPACVWPCDNEEWQLHCALVEASEDGPYSRFRHLMFQQIQNVFGDSPRTPEDFALASQIVQAEAFKFFIESFRLKKWRCTGIIWWNLIDGWPQFSNGVVDYYFRKKLAFHFIRQAQQPLCLLFEEPADGKLNLKAANDTAADIHLTYTVTDIACGETVLSGKADAAADAVTGLTSLPVREDAHTLYFIQWHAGENSGTNHYLYGTPVFNREEVIGWMRKAGLLIMDGFEGTVTQAAPQMESAVIGR